MIKWLWKTQILIRTNPSSWNYCYSILTTGFSRFECSEVSHEIPNIHAFFFLSSKIQVMTSQNWSDPHCDSIKFVIFDHSFHFQSFPAHRIWHNELTFIKYSLIFRLQFGEKQNWNHFQASKYDPDKRSNSKVRIIIEIKIVATLITFYGFKVCERVSLNSFFLF